MNTRNLVLGGLGVAMAWLTPPGLLTSYLMLVLVLGIWQRLHQIWFYVLASVVFRFIIHPHEPNVWVNFLTAATISTVGTFYLKRNKLIAQDVDAELVRLKDHLSDAYILIDPKFTVLDWNQTAAKIFGYTHIEAVGRKLGDMCGHELKAHLESCPDLTEFSSEGSRRSGESFPIRVQRWWIGDNTGVLIIDEVKLRQAVEGLQQKVSELEQFTHIAAHDLREPLTQIEAYCGLLQRQYGHLLDTKAQSYIQFITNSSGRSSKLIAALAEYSLFSDQIPTLRLVNLNDVVRRVLDHSMTNIMEVHAEVIIDSLPDVWGHETNLFVLLRNLISNAIKFRRRDAGLTISVGSRITPQTWIITVSDNGQGVKPEQYKQIFKPFKRACARTIPGTGMGLAICAKIVKQHGGEIWVEPNEQYGSTFCFSISRFLRIDTIGGGRSS